MASATVVPATAPVMVATAAKVATEVTARAAAGAESVVLTSSRPVGGHAEGGIASGLRLSRDNQDGEQCRRHED